MEHNPAQPLKPSDLAGFIREHGIDATVVPMQMETPTVPAAAAALGVEPAQIIKTLVFLVKEAPVVVIASGDTMVDRRPLADRYGVGKKQVKLADAQTALDVTGYPVGGVPPFGHLTHPPVLLDRRIQGWDVVYGGGGDDRTLLRVTPTELAQVTRGDWISLA
jgi:Cys-tRNA(Pro) deacylase